MRIGNSVGLDDILIELRKCVGETEIVWLTNLFKNILKSKRTQVSGENFF